MSSKWRTLFYIDGFNLYFGLRDWGLRKHYWLNLEQLCSRLIKPDQMLVKIRYFTARINQANKEKRKRQLTYLEALETRTFLEIHYGTYLAHKEKCLNCGHTFLRHTEKKSDVNLAVSVITDAIDDLYDNAVLISADSDLVPAMEAIKEYFPKKRTILFFPPNRKSASLKEACHRFGGVLGENIVARSQFPDTVISRDNYPLRRPEYWK